MNIAGVKIEPSVNVVYAYDDNYRFAEKKESAFSINVNPSLDLRYEKGIADINFNIRSPYRYFSESTGKKSKFQETYFNSEMKLKLPARIKLRLEDDFVSTNLSPFLTEERFDRTERSENRFSGNVYVPFGSMFGVTLDYRNENYRYVDTDSVFFSFSRNDRKLDNVNVRFSFKPVKGTNVFVRYWYQRNLYKNDSSRSSQSRQIDYGLEQSIGDFFRITGQIGTGKRKTNAVVPLQDDRLTWSSSVLLNLSKDFSLYYNVNKTVVSTSYQNILSENNTRRTLSMFFSLRAKISDNSDIDIIASKTSSISNAVQEGDTIFKNVTVRLENNFFDRIRGEFEYRYGINTFEGGAFSFSGVKREDKRWSVEGSLIFKLTGKTSLNMGYLHENRLSYFGNFKRNRISLSINFVL